MVLTSFDDETKECLWCWVDVWKFFFCLGSVIENPDCQNCATFQHHLNSSLSWFCSAEHFCWFNISKLCGAWGADPENPPFLSQTQVSGLDFFNRGPVWICQSFFWRSIIKHIPVVIMIMVFNNDKKVECIFKKSFLFPRFSSLDWIVEQPQMTLWWKNNDKKVRHRQTNNLLLCRCLFSCYFLEWLSKRSCHCNALVQ